MQKTYSSNGSLLWRWAFGLFCSALLVYLILPILVMVPLSFNEGSFLSYPISGFSLRWYKAFLDSQDWIDALRNSLIVAPAATILATLLGTLAAMGLSRGEFPGKALVMALIISPMVVPLVIVAVGMYFFFARMDLVNTYSGMILAHTALGLPFVVTTVSATLQGYDSNLSRAAASLGASPMLTFRRVTLPLIGPGVAAGALLAFATSFDEVVVTLFLAGPTQRTLPIQMFGGIKENLDPTIAAAATLLIGSALALLIVMEWVRRRSERMRGNGH
ncbi:ABC transporter permease [Herbaspirillum sp. DW155]|uniref:ABC transporter permease n=1 Tax=Herbaspirillum sp. DW155 TaxID=3095609 RepID=UPI0030860978|nr:ABC transporter permease [Herbaspirillum sp. DW155]